MISANLVVNMLICNPGSYLGKVRGLRGWLNFWFDTICYYYYILRRPNIFNYDAFEWSVYSNLHNSLSAGRRSYTTPTYARSVTTLPI